MEDLAPPPKPLEGNGLDKAFDLQMKARWYAEQLCEWCFRLLMDGELDDGQRTLCISNYGMSLPLLPSSFPEDRKSDLDPYGKDLWCYVWHCKDVQDFSWNSLNISRPRSSPMFPVP
jgi:hypothetical protein